MRDILYRYPGDPRDFPSGYLVEDVGPVMGFGTPGFGNGPVISDAQVTQAVTQAIQVAKTVWGIAVPGPVTQSVYNQLLGNAHLRLVGPNPDAPLDARIEQELIRQGVYVSAPAPAKKANLLPLLVVGGILLFTSK